VNIEFIILSIEIIEDLKQFSVALESRSSLGKGHSQSRSSRRSVIVEKSNNFEKFDSIHHLSQYKKEVSYLDS
jgi:hypothetical protein